MLQILTMKLIQAKFRHETELLLSSVTQVKSHHSNALSYTHVQRNGLDDVALVLEAIPASSTGNFETLDSKFRHETDGLLPSSATSVKSNFAS